MIVLVMVVPMLAPMIIGTASIKLIDPEATAATIKVVLVELLCIRAVISKPMKSPMNGFDAAFNMDSMASLPRCLNESLIRSIENKNRNIDAIMIAILIKSHRFDINVSVMILTKINGGA
ncbi:hypothetical protein GCM10009122_22230 [Fulvivirga kasyanovii]